MKIFSPSTELRINGNYGVTPNMSSIWFAGNGTSSGAYTNANSVYINLSPSIPACYIGFDIKTRHSATQPASGFLHRWGMVSAIAGYGVNAGGASLSANNQNYNWYTVDGEGNAGQPLQLNFDGGNRRFAIGYNSIDSGMTQCVYVRVVSLYINYITISWA
jgi:hypothetical protein